MARAASILAVIQLATQTATQLVLPPVLLRAWGDSGYALFIAVQSFAGYVSVADAGIQVYLIQKLATLRARGEHELAMRTTAGGLRALGVLASGGALLVFAAFVATGRPIWHDLGSRIGVPPAVALTAALAQFVSGGVSLLFGGWSTAVDSGHGRYVRLQVFGLARVTLVTIATLVPAALGGSASLALFVASVGGIMFDATRFSLTYRDEPRIPARHAVSIPRVLRDAAGSVVLMLATTTQNGLQPYVTAVMSPAVVSIVVPGRTLANGARSVSGAIGSVLWVPVAARFAEMSDPAARHRFWTRNAPVLSLVQLAGILALLVLAPLVVPLWLPAKSRDILSLLPYYCVEQGVYVAVLPTIVLLQAAGRFAVLGVATLLSAVVSTIAITIFVPRYGASAFAFANAAAAQLILAPCLLLSEWLHWRRCGIRKLGSLPARALALVLTLVVAVLYTRERSLANALLLATTVVAGGYVLWLRRRPAASR